MKLILSFIFILYFSLASAQTIEKNKYINDRLGISFQVDENWKLSMDNSTVSAVNRSKSELITFK